MPIISLDGLSLSVSLAKVFNTYSLALLLFEARANATGSLFMISTAKVGPDITAIFLVFKLSFTIFDKSSSRDYSIPLDAIHIGTSGL